MTDGAGYAQRHLEHSDYYDEGRRVQGEWHGCGAELLGLCGEVTRKQFEAVREGLHPETGEFEFKKFFYRPQDLGKRGKW